MKQYSYPLGALALGLVLWGLPRAAQAVGEAGCANLVILDCEDCASVDDDDAAANDLVAAPALRTSSPTCWSCVASAEAMQAYGNGMTGGSVGASLEYHHAVTDYAVAWGGESCEPCGAPPVWTGIRSGIEANFSLRHQRIFRSRLWKETTGFGRRWTYNYDYQFSVSPEGAYTIATLRFPGGNYWKWIDVGSTGVFVEHGSLPKATSKASLELVADGYLVTTKYGERIHLAPMLDDPKVDYRPDWMESKNGVRLSFTYDAVADGIDRLVAVSDGFGRSLSYEWGLLGGTEHVVSRVTLPDGREVRYDFTGPDDYTVTYANGDVTSYSGTPVAGGGMRYSFDDARGHAGSRKHRVTTRPNGQVQQVEDAASHLLYESAWIDPLTIEHRYLTGLVETYTITPSGYPVSLTDSVTGATRTTSWDELASLVTEETDALGNTTRYSYDDHELTGVTYPDGSTTSCSFVGALRESYTDPLGRVHRYAYDTRGNLTEHTYPDGTRERWTVNAHGQVLTYQDRRGHVTRAEYDPLANLVRLSLPDDDGLPGNEPTWQFAYDLNGKRLSQTDPMGRVTQFEYDLVDRPVRVTYPDGTTSEQLYGTNGSDPSDPAGTTNLVVGVKDRNDHWTLRTYDRLDNLLTEADALGTALVQTFQPGTDLLLSRDREGDRVSYTYDAKGRELSESVESYGTQSLTTTYEYDALDRVVKLVDPYGFERTTTFDGMGRVVQEAAEYATGSTAVTGYGYDAIGNQVTRTDPRGEVWVVDYDLSDRRVREVDPLGAEVLYTYDGVGNLLTRSVEIDEGRYGVTTWTYSARSQVLTETDAVGNVVLLGYDLDDNPATRTNLGTGGQQLFDYGCCGRLVGQTTVVDGGAKDIVETFAYDGTGNPTQHTDGEGFVWTTVFDERGRVVQRIDPLGNLVETTYLSDGAPFDGRLTPGQGRCELQTDALGNQRATVYCAAGRVLAELDELGNPTRYSYDHLVGDRIGVRTTDRLGHMSWTWSDGLGRELEAVDALGNADLWSYDPGGKRLTATDATGQTTLYTYDAAGRLVQETFADGGVVQHGHYRNGWPASRTDQAGNLVGYLVDDAGRRVKTLYPGGLEDVQVFDLGGRLVSATTGLYPTGLPIARAYDPADRLVVEVQMGQAIGYAYDRRSLRTTLTLPSGIELRSSYTPRGLLDTVEALGTTYVDHGYDAAGRLVQRLLANGTTTDLDYDQRGWPSRIGHALGGLDLGSLAYTFDLEGNKLSEEDLAHPGQSQAFSYDAEHRLVGWQRGPLGGPASKVQAWSLDPVGNWATTTVDGLTETRVHGLVHELAQRDLTSLAYDPRGNLVDDGSLLYEWDLNDRLAVVRHKADGALVAQYGYDVLGRRVARIDHVTPEARIYLHDGARVLQERSLALGHVATYLYGSYIDEPLVRFGAGIHYYHAGAQYSPALLTDDSGAVVERYAYDAYGAWTTFDPSWSAPMASSRVGNPYGFTGRRLDPETGLYHFRARPYSPDQGRFVARDPSGFTYGANLYGAYFVPSGLDPTGLGGYWLGKYACTDGSFTYKSKTYVYTDPDDTDCDGYASKLDPATGCRMRCTLRTCLAVVYPD